MTQSNVMDLLQQDRQHLLHPLHHPDDHVEPLVLVKGEGAVVWDAQGREFLDGLAGLWNTNVGHGRKELAEAGAAQMSTLAFSSGYIGSSNVPAIELSTRLSQLAYPSLNTVFFTSGGAESNESAFKTARFYWKAKGKPEKVKVISRWHAYHGVTMAAMSATGIQPFWKMFEPRVPGFVHIQAPYPYRFEGARPGETIGAAAARALEDAIVEQNPDTVAAFIAEPVQGAGGVDRSARRLFSSRPGNLFQAQDSLHCRRGHHRVRPHRAVVRLGAMGRRTRHHVFRQGGNQRILAAGRHHGLG